MKKHYIFSYLGLVLPLIFSSIFLHAQAWQTKSQSDSLINAYLSQVNSDSVETHIQYLEDKGTRFMIAPNRRAVAESIKNKFLLLGADDARIDSFLCETKINYSNLHYDTTTWQYNVIGTLNGITDANQCMVMGAHYDDVVAPEGDPLTFAPGADDNASGVSALFECVRILSQNEYQPAYDIEFVAFAAEELMYYGNSGAQAYVDSTLAAGRNIELMINNDMIAYTSDDNWRISISNYAESLWLTAVSKSIVEDYTSIIPKVRQLTYEAGADCKYFYDAGIPCVYFMEYDFNPFYHTINDLIENAAMDYCAEAIKISLGTILTVLDTTTTGLEERARLFAKVYPNPTNGQVKLKLETRHQTEPLIYSIVDLKGRMLAGGNISSDEEIVVNLDGLPEGIYLVNFQSSTKLVSKKLVLTRN